MRIERLAFGTALAAVLFAAGCSDPTVADVSGNVTVGGKPLAEGSVKFVPKDGKSTTAGGTVKDGRYSVRMSPGTMIVSFSAGKVIGKKKAYNTPDSPEIPITAEALPAKYNVKTELTLEVKPGSNSKDWALDEK